MSVGSYLDRSITKGALIRMVNRSPEDRVDFQYNPETVEREIENVWYRPEYPGRWLGNAAYMRSGTRKTQFEILLYSRTAAGVDSMKAKLESFCAPSAGFSAGNTTLTSPGFLRLVLGVSNTYDVTLNKATFRTSMWNADMNAMITRVSLEMEQVTQGVAAEVDYWRRMRTRGGN